MDFNCSTGFSYWILISFRRNAKKKNEKYSPAETRLEITLKPDVTVMGDKTLEFLVTGYNTRSLLPPLQSQRTWIFATRAPDSGKTVLDEKKGVSSFPLRGVVRVEQVWPKETKVRETFNI